MTKQVLLPTLALVLALVALLRPVRNDREEEAGSTRAEVAEFAAQLRELRSQVTAQASRAASPSLAAPEVRRDPALEARLDRVEAVLKDLEPLLERRATTPPLPLPPREGLDRPTAGSPEEQVAIVLDLRQSSAARLAAVKRLRGAGPYLNEDRVVAELIAWLPTEADAAIRADVIRNLGKPTHQRLIDGLIEVLRRDTDPKVREEAAETLGKNPTAPGVKEALETAAAHDADAKVRAQAARASDGDD